MNNKIATYLFTTVTSDSCHYSTKGGVTILPDADERNQLTKNFQDVQFFGVGKPKHKITKLTHTSLF